MKILKLSLAGLMIVSALFMLSCKKNNDSSSSVDNDVSGASDNALAEGTSNDVVAIAGEVADNDSMPNLRLQPEEVLFTGCVDSISKVGKVITVYFNGNTCKDGRTRSG